MRDDDLTQRAETAEKSLRACAHWTFADYADTIRDLSAAFVRAEQALVGYHDSLAAKSVRCEQAEWDLKQTQAKLVQAEQHIRVQHASLADAHDLLTRTEATVVHAEQGKDRASLNLREVENRARSAEARLATQEATMRDVTNESQALREIFAVWKKYTGQDAAYLADLGRLAEAAKAQEATIRQVEQEMLKYYSPDRETVLRWADTLRAILPAEQTAVKGPDAPQADR